MSVDNPETTTSSYIRVDDMAKRVAQWGQNSKVDTEEAYSLAPIHSDDKHLLGVQWEGLVYIDTAIPFDLRIAHLSSLVIPVHEQLMRHFLCCLFSAMHDLTLTVPHIPGL